MNMKELLKSREDAVELYVEKIIDSLHNRPSNWKINKVGWTYHGYLSNINVEYLGNTIEDMEIYNPFGFFSPCKIVFIGYNPKRQPNKPYIQLPKNLRKRLHKVTKEWAKAIALLDKEARVKDDIKILMKHIQGEELNHGK